MSEEVIIDGVDVAECEYYTQDYQRANHKEGRYEHCKDVCELNGENYFYCKMNKNCHYKQLKRLQVKNEGLKSTNNFIVKQLERRVNQLREYRKALEEIREYASAIEQEELIAGYAIRAKSALWRIVKKINEVLK